MDILKVEDPPVEADNEDDKSNDDEKSGGEGKKVVSFT